MTYCPECGADVSDDDYYCTVCGASLGKTTRESFSISGDDVLKKVRELIHEGNVNKIIIKNEEGFTLLVMPVTIGVVGTILVPWMAAIGAIAALATRCTIDVERRVEGEEDS